MTPVMPGYLGCWNLLFSHLWLLMGIATSGGVSPITTLLRLGVPEWDRPDSMLRIYYYRLYTITSKDAFSYFLSRQLMSSTTYYIYISWLLVTY